MFAPFRKVCFYAGAQRSKVGEVSRAYVVRGTRDWALYRPSSIVLRALEPDEYFSHHDDANMKAGRFGE